MVEEDVETRSMIRMYALKVFWEGLTPSLFPFKSRWILKVAHLVLQGKDLQVEGKEKIGLGDHQVLAHLKTPWKRGMQVAVRSDYNAQEISFLWYASNIQPQPRKIRALWNVTSQEKSK